MQKILVRHVLNQSIYLMAWLVLTIGALFGFDYFLDFEESMTLGEMIANGHFNAISAILILRFVFQLYRLPDVLFIMPISRNERLQIIKKLFRVMWLESALWLSLLINLPMIIRVLSGMKVEAVVFVESFIITLGMLSVTYLLCYNGYFESIKSYHTFVIMFLVILQLIVLGILARQILTGGLPVYILIVVVYGIFGLVNMRFCKRFFDKMLQYYADYESCRQLESRSFKF